jgi:hypothetical protein
MLGLVPALSPAVPTAVLPPWPTRRGSALPKEATAEALKHVLDGDYVNLDHDDGSSLVLATFVGALPMGVATHRHPRSQDIYRPRPEPGR